MKKRFTEEQIIQILRQIDEGKTAKEVSRKEGVTLQTIYSWKKKYAGMSSEEAKRLRALENENARLKRLVADLSLDNQILKDVNTKEW